jgi:hypothetical protein
MPSPLLVGAGVGLAAAAGVGLRTRRARRLAKELPPGEAVAALRPLLVEGDPVTRKVAVRLLKALPGAGTELVPAAAPGGRGDEVAPGRHGADR